MRLKQVLHPEMVLGKRGSPLICASLKMMLDDMKWHPEDRKFSAGNKVTAFDPNFTDHIALVRRWLTDNGKVFHVNRDFLKEISKVDKAIPIDRLPERFVGYISFAEKTLTDDTGFVQGAYVYVGPADQTTFMDAPGVTTGSQKVLWISSINEGEGEISALRLVLTGDRIEELLRLESSLDTSIADMSEGRVVLNSATSTTENLNARAVIFRTLLNLVLYIHQPDPELVRVRSADELSNSQKKQVQAATGIANDSTLPVTFVNWRWMRPLSEHTVSGHFKWAACGPMMVQRKLLWVDAYLRGEADLKAEA